MNDDHEEEDPDLDRLTMAVSNGERVDWAEEILRRPDLRPLIEQLRIAESVAESHRLGDKGPEAAPIRWGPLRLLERVGQGGVGEVFRAFDPRLQTEVALKLLRRGAESEARMMQEGRRMARVRHPNVLAVYGADRHDGRTGIWTEMLQGRTLEELLASNGPFGAGEATRIGLDLCRALAAVHGAGLVHRDVKTNNVMREQGGRIVLMDFGAGAEQGLAQEGGLAEDGTALILAPEQLRGEPATPASDLYSLGVLLYRLVSCRFPVEASTYSELHDLHDRGVRIPLRDLRPDLPARFIAILDRALEPPPERRFSTAGELEKALMGAFDEALPEDGPSPPRRRPLGTRWLLSAALVGLAIAWIAWGRRDSGTPSVVRPPVAGAPDRAATGGKDYGGQETSAREEVQGGTSRASERATAQGAPLVASAALLRERDGRAEALAPGDPVRPGDGLALRFQSEEPAYVYVLAEDAEGEVFVLFPAPGTELSNPLAPGTLHRLPGTRAGRRLSWRVTSAGGHETVIAIATRRPFEALEAEIAKFPRASLDRPVMYERLSEEGLATLRGIGGMSESDVAGGADRGRRLSDLVRRLGVAGNAGAPWTWQMELANPR